MSKKQSSPPHDALFKLFLRQPETARDFLGVPFTGTYSRAL
ncbi:putative transposase [Escherichia coli]|nr:putative transposase [Escherichia coli]